MHEAAFLQLVLLLAGHQLLEDVDALDEPLAELAGHLAPAHALEASELRRNGVGAERLDLGDKALLLLAARLGLLRHARDLQLGLDMLSRGRGKIARV